MRGKDKDPAHRGSKDGNDRGARVCDAQKTRERRERKTCWAGDQEPDLKGSAGNTDSRRLSATTSPS